MVERSSTGEAVLDDGGGRGCKEEVARAGNVAAADG